MSNSNSYFNRLRENRRYCIHCGGVTHTEQSHWNNNYRAVCSYRCCPLYGINIDDQWAKQFNHKLYGSKQNYNFFTGELIGKRPSWKLDVFASYFTTVV